MQKLWCSAGGQCRCLCAMRRYRYLACTAPWHAAALPKPTATLSPPILSVPLWPAALSTAGGSPQRRLSCARLLLPHCWPDPLPCLEGSEAALCACHRQMGAVGFIANTILIIIGIVFSLLLYSVAAPSYYDFGSYNDIVYGISMAIRMIAR